ncbi:hypothetical protein BGX20_004471, partial [Mortierella sp. AD010]
RKVIQEEMEPGLARQKIGPVCISLAEAAAVLAIRASPTDNTKPRVIYSDGSLINTNTDNVAMAFRAVDLSQPVARVVHGRTDRYASSAKAELMGLFAAILSAPPNQDVRSYNSSSNLFTTDRTHYPASASEVHMQDYGLLFTEWFKTGLAQSSGLGQRT